MRPLLLAAISAALVVPAHGAAATPNPAPRPKAALSAASTAAAPQSLATLRRAAFVLANRYAAQAPRLSTRQKARNATTLAKRLRLPNIALRERAVAIGKTQLGTKYKYGGTTPAGFDCSGLTGFAYAHAGKRLPRTAAQQKRATRQVTSPRIGDLVFLGGRTPYHVGLYVGNGKMLHSPRAGKPVQVAKIWAPATYGRI